VSREEEDSVRAEVEGTLTKASPLGPKARCIGSWAGGTVAGGVTEESRVSGLQLASLEASPEFPLQLPFRPGDFQGVEVRQVGLGRT
jgi:hypothetical protein